MAIAFNWENESTFTENLHDNEFYHMWCKPSFSIEFDCSIIIHIPFYSEVLLVGKSNTDKKLSL